MAITREDSVTATLEVIKRTLGLFVMHPEAIRVTAPIESEGVVVPVEIVCHPCDARRVVGTSGNHYRALGVLAKTVGGRLGIKVDLLPLDIESQDEQYPRFRLNPEWPRASVEGLLNDVLKYCFFSSYSTEVKEHASATMFDVDVWDNVPPKMVEKLAGSLQTLFRSIGKKQGWNLIVSVHAKKSLHRNSQPS